MSTPAIVSRIDSRALPQWGANNPGFVAMQSGSVGAGNSDGERHGTRFGTTLRRYWWVALLLWAIAAIPASVYIYKTIPPQYVASGTINIAPVVTNPVTREGMATPFYTEFLRSQADMLKNPYVLQEAARQPQMKTFAWFRDLPDPVGYLMDNVTVESLPSTENIRITMTHRDAAAAKAIVDSVLDAYLQISKKQAESENEKSLGILKGLQATTDQSLKEAQTQLAKLVSEGDMGWSETSRKVMSDVLSSARLTAAKLEGDQFSLQAQLTNLQERKLPDEALYIATIPVETDGAIVEWTGQRAQVQADDAALAARGLGPAHPQRAGNQRQLQAIDEKIKARRTEIQAAAWNNYRAGFELDQARKINDTQADLAAVTQQINLLNDRINMQETAAREMGNKTQPIASLREQIADAKDSLKRYNDRIDEVTRQNLAPGRISTMATILPRSATVDKRPKMAAAANGIGLMLGLAALVVLMKLRDKIDHAEDLPASFQPLVVGTVSHAGIAARGANGRITRKILGEEMRLLHANLLPPGPSARRIMMITSPTPSNGKTSIASNLAVSLAKSGMRVLLIDADLRKRDLSTLYDVGFRPGLAELLQGHAPELISPVELLPNLRLMGAGGKLDRNPVELFQRQHFHESLNLLQEQFDCIVVDTPPTLVVADARLIARSCDEVLCVVRAQVTSPKEVNQTLDALNRITGKTPKIILNGVAHRQNYYKYKFSYTANEESDMPAASPEPVA